MIMDQITGKIRKALPTDLQDIFQLLEMNELPTVGVQQHLHQFLVWENTTESQIGGCIGLEVYGQDALLRSLSVHPQHQGKGIGSHLLSSIIENAKMMNIKNLFLLTTTADMFFERHHFTGINRDAVSGGVKESVEFRSVCPSTAICMTRNLDI